MLLSITQRFGLAVAVLGLMVGAAGQARAGLTITFDDLTTTDSFYDQGIQTTYQGFKWGYSTTPGITSAILPTDTLTGWASATVSHPAWYPAPTPVSGTSYAWNYDGAQSLFIDFRGPQDVTGGYFATLSSTYSSNASTIQLFGYDNSNNLLGSSTVLNLSDSFQYLSANLTGVTKLEIRADANKRWFSIDNIVLNSSIAPVPEPTNLAGSVLGVLLASGTWLVLRKRRVAGVTSSLPRSSADGAVDA